MPTAIIFAGRCVVVCKIYGKTEINALFPGIAFILLFNIPTPGDFWWQNANFNNPLWKYILFTGWDSCFLSF